MRSSVWRRSERAAALLAAVMLVAGTAPGAAATSRGVGDALVARLARAGRAEVRIERRSLDPLTGRPRAAAGRLALEQPDRARLDFDRDGESVTLRADGGEWLQPALRQMIRFGPESARPGLRWWNVMLGGEAHVERALGRSRFLLVLPAAGGGGPDSAWATVDAEGLPRRLEIVDADGAHAEYRLQRWRFLAPRGAEDFVLRPVKGYEVVDLR